MKKRRYYHRRNIYHGNYIDVQMFPLFQTGLKKSRGKKTTPTREMQRRLNENNKINKCIRLANENFTKNDYALHLTYSDSNVPQNTEAVKKDIQNFLRRAKRRYFKEGIELKYMWTAARGERSGRPHFHLIISGGILRRELEKLWDKGYAHTTQLRFGIEGIAGFAKYFCNQEKILYRTWSCSKNLKRPEEESKIAGAEVYEIADEYIENYSYSNVEKMYPGYGVARIKVVKNDVFGGAYVMARLYRKAGKYINEREG